MKQFLKAVAALAIVMTVNIIVNIACNMYGIDLNSIATTTLSALCAIWIYHALNK